ncbi:DUF6151 family protein [Billgrantia gudaonensis]|uniref:CENP-V/GFA domain-containing protein n=1 Tax=Billgrantia gudaonensis TaxID=376427 RepID=A0A1G8NQP0_9GAMM|nr:DUF6151 family protein [Halomonas gudaonensis]SDI82482.1 hypothetical protein SAMN04487954_101402 [Halomonas gudaonensis]
MEVQCECGKFRAKLKAFPNNTPGRLVCYCDDCQSYLRYIKREDLLDVNGGTEVVPAYPADVEIISGLEHLKCTRLAPNGLFRFSTSCCNTPVANTRPTTPWIGLLSCVYTARGSNRLDQVLGPVRSRIMGRYAKGTPPAGTPAKFNMKAFVTVLPFILKGKLLKKAKPSPFFAENGVTPIVPPYVLSEAERQAGQYTVDR